MTEQSAGVGHNVPPEDAIEARRATIHEDLGSRFAHLLAGRDSVLDEFGRMPEVIDDEETAGKVADFIKKVGGYAKDAESARKSEKEVYLEGGRLVDGFFSQISEKLKKAKTQAADRLTLYQRKKAEEERRAREEAERKAREAEEAERRKAEEERLKAAALEAAAEENKEAEQPMTAAAERAMGAAETAESLADQHAADAVDAGKAARAKPADLSRTRGDFGGTASLRQTMTFEIDNPGEIDLEVLRPYLRIEDLERAIRQYIKAGGRELDGVRIFPKTTTVVR